jgi:hypothetical protein
MGDLHVRGCEQRFRVPLPEEPGEPMRVQPNRAKRPTSENN